MFDLSRLYVGDNEELRLYFRIIDSCKLIIEYIVERDMTIRQVSDNSGLSKSTIHLYIHTYIKSYFNDDYMQIVRILQRNKLHRFKPRKYW